MTSANRIGFKELDAKTESRGRFARQKLNVGGSKMTSRVEGGGEDVNSLTRRKQKKAKEHADQNISESKPELGSERIR